MSEIEDRLRAALAARAELVEPEHLAPLAPAAAPRPRWQSPWVLLATAAAVLLVLGVVLQGVGRDSRSDEVAPRPGQPEPELPADIGRGWERNDLDRPPRLDLDGDGVDEKVVFRAEPTPEHDGRFRMETTLSSTGEEAYGIAEVGTTIATNVLDPIDADGDGDQELVLYYDDAEAVGGGGYPLVLDLRDGLLVRAVPEDADLLQRGTVPVPGSQTEHYDMVVIHRYWFEDGRLYSARSTNSFARGNMSLYRPDRVAMESWVWRLDEAGVLRAEEAGCRLDVFEEIRPCDAQTEDDPLEVGPPAVEHWGVGEGGDITQGYRFSVRLEPGSPPSLVVEGDDGRSVRREVDVPDPQVATVQPWGVAYDGASVVLTSESDPDAIRLWGQDGDRLLEMRAVGEVPFGNGTTADGRSYRSWVTVDGGVVTAVSLGEDQWEIWGWQLLRGSRMTAMPRGQVCIADITDPGAGC